MKRNWYAVFTKATCEKKTAVLLSKKGIESYCPANKPCMNQHHRKKNISEVIFPGFVFIHINEAEMSYIRQTISMVSFGYWLGKPAVIQAAEINKISFFEKQFSDILLVKTAVSPQSLARITEEPVLYLSAEKLVPEKNFTVKLSLPSLGYMLVARSKNSVVMSPELSLLNNTAGL